MNKLLYNLNILNNILLKMKIKNTIVKDHIHFIIEMLKKKIVKHLKY